MSALEGALRIAGNWAAHVSLVAAFLAALTLLLRLAPVRLKDRLMVGYGVDAIIAAFTIGPIVFSLAIGGGWSAGVVGSLIYLALWCVADEALRATPGQFSIRKHWITRDGWARYTLGWIILLAIPVFWAIRLAEEVVYPVLRLGWGLPKIELRELVALSRHKTKGLVGADYLFCVYCEWMTGVWSLGTLQLRHLESMWCPLRFGRADQCERCQSVFPDIADWADPAQGVEGVRTFYELHYEGRPLGERRAVCERKKED